MMNLFRHLDFWSTVALGGDGGGGGGGGGGKKSSGKKSGGKKSSGKKSSGSEPGFFGDGGAFESFFDGIGLDFDGDAADGVSGGVSGGKPTGGKPTGGASAGDRAVANDRDYSSSGSFDTAFADARDDLGPGQTFSWNGNEYSTAYAGEDPALDAAMAAQSGGTSVGGRDLDATGSLVDTPSGVKAVDTTAAGTMKGAQTYDVGGTAELAGQLYGTDENGDINLSADAKNALGVDPLDSYTVDELAAAIAVDTGADAGETTTTTDMGSEDGLSALAGTNLLTDYDAQEEFNALFPNQEGTTVDALLESTAQTGGVELGGGETGGVELGGGETGGVELGGGETGGVDTGGGDTGGVDTGGGDTGGGELGGGETGGGDTGGGDTGGGDTGDGPIYEGGETTGDILPTVDFECPPGYQKVPVPGGGVTCQPIEAMRPKIAPYLQTGPGPSLYGEDPSRALPAPGYTPYRPGVRPR